MTSTKGFFILLALVGLNCVFCEESFEWVAPKFCNGLSCPKYTVIKTTEDYEVRKYEDSNWVTTTEEGIDLDMIRSVMFRRLFNYITGNNQGNQKIDMTAPVLSKITPGPGPACTNNFTMGFYIASEIVSPPKPADPTVEVITLPGQTVYVKSFGGYARMPESVLAVAELVKKLPKGAKFEKSHWYKAGYDSPFKPFDRHNEVWLVKV